MYSTTSVRSLWWGFHKAATTARATATPTTTTVRHFARSQKGTGWYRIYRSGKGGRSFQGEYYDRETLEQCEQWNNNIFALGSTKAYLDVVMEPKALTLLAAEKDEFDDADPAKARERAIEKAVAIAEARAKMTAGKRGAYVPPLDSLQAPVQRLELELASAVMPETCHNFITLCQNQDYNGTLLYRFEPKVGLCGGDILTNTGATGRSHRKDRLTVNVHSEPLALWHIAGTVSMLVASVQEIDSRFFFCTAPQSQHLDGIHRAFGRLSDDSLKLVQQWHNEVYTRNGIPTQVDIVVVKAGLLEDGDDVLTKDTPLVQGVTPPAQAASATA